MAKDSIDAAPVADETSRVALLDELKNLGANPDLFANLTVDQLADLVTGLSSSVASGEMQKQELKAKSGNYPTLSSIDKKIMVALLTSHGNPSSMQLSRELDIPITTVQRRRNRLEAELIVDSYSLKYGKFGLRHITFIATLSGEYSPEIGREILALKGVSSLVHTFGDGVDLRIEAVVETNVDLMHMSDSIRAVPGVIRVSWFESLEILGKNEGMDLSIIKMQ